MTQNFPNRLLQAFLLFFLLNLWGSLHGQIQSQWMIGTDSTNEKIYGMTLTAGQQILMAMNEDIDVLGQTDIGVRLVSRSGQLLNRTIIGSPWDDFTRGLERAGDNQFLLTGMRTAFNPFRQLSTIMMIDSLGQIQWEWVHPDTSSISEFKIARIDKNGEIVACGNISSPGQKIRSLVMRFDENGNMIGEFTQQDTVNEISHAAWPVGNNSWIIAGDRQMPDLTYRPYLMKIDGEDSLIWRQHYDEQVNGGAQNLIGLEGGNLMLIGESYPAPGIFAFDIFLRKVDPSGGSFWYQTYGADGADAGFGVVESPIDQSLSFTGYYLNPLTNNTDAVVFQVDSNGVELGRTWAGGSEIDYGNVIQRDKYDTLWIAGFSNQGLDSQGLLAKHSWSNPVNSIDPFSKISVTCYPNPVSPGAPIRIAASHPFSSIRITSLLGEQVYSDSFPLTSELSLPQELPAGNYVVQLLLDQKPVNFRLLISP